MDYKNTLNLPKTDFPMKANLSAREPEILAKWEKLGIYRKLRSAFKGRKLFILHDGPPYANGQIHIGHALNKILKDIIVRYKTMRGFDAPYIPGWDCHGLPVEHQLFKDLKKTKDQIDRVEFRKLANAFAMKYVEIQKDEFKRLGVIGDWEHPYLTLDKDYERVILSSFAQLVDKGFVYRGLKPVNWCFKCETALAEAEVEYADHESDSVYVKFTLKDEEHARRLGISFDRKDPPSICVWTTTPWTLIANVAVAVHPDMEYVLVDFEIGEQMIVAHDLFESSLREKFPSAGEPHIRKHFQGKELEGLVYSRPFSSKEGRVVLADYVSKEEGTGCVHTAPGHGQEDFMTGQKYNLETIMPVNEKGIFDQSAGEFSGQHVFAANEKIIEKLKGLDRLKSIAKISHTYPHCWRCKNPIIFRATQQWFLSINHNDLRNQLVEVIKKDIQWIPPSGLERISSMVETRPDWCLSRQRYWGVPIPAVICKACQKHILDVRVIEKLADRSATEGTDAWFKDDIKVFLPQGFKCSCGKSEFEKSTEILDVWFDSGVSHQAVLKDKPGLKLPADLYLEGSDQHRGWFQSSLIPSMAIDSKTPFESVLTHGFVVDGEGRKMSKSLGNVISPQDIIRQSGADILRLWVLASDYNEDVRISKEILASLTDAYRKIRNTVRYLLGNLADYDPEKDRLPKDELLEIDKWALFWLSDMIKAVTEDYESYRFHRVYQGVYNFCNDRMSSVYLDILKDRLYTSGKGSRLRRSAQTTLYEILNALMRILVPVLPFTAEEIYGYIVKGKGESFDSVQMLKWPGVPKDYSVSSEEIAGTDLILGFRPDILKALEEKRSKGEIGSALEAKIILSLKDEKTYEIFNGNLKQLPYLFIVSQVELKKDKALPGELGVFVARADGKKCARCWNYSSTVDTISGYPGICDRCVEAVSSLK